MLGAILSNHTPIPGTFLQSRAVLCSHAEPFRYQGVLACGMNASLLGSHHICVYVPLSCVVHGEDRHLCFLDRCHPLRLREARRLLFCVWFVFVPLGAVLSCDVLSCSVLLCPALLYAVLSGPDLFRLLSPCLSYPALCCPILSYPILSYPILLYPVLL